MATARLDDPAGAPGMIRTCDPLIRSAITSSASGYGSYDLLTFVTGCSRQRVHLLPPIQTSFAVVLSQVCRNRQSISDCRSKVPPRKSNPNSVPVICCVLLTDWPLEILKILSTNWLA